jgi:hypothetical protein
MADRKTYSAEERYGIPDDHAAFVVKGSKRDADGIEIVTIFPEGTLMDAPPSPTVQAVLAALNCVKQLGEGSATLRALQVLEELPADARSPEIEQAITILRDGIE